MKRIQELSIVPVAKSEQFEQQNNASNGLI